MKKNKIIILLSTIILALTMSLLTFNVKADSGWDFDYDSSDSWDSGSDWDSDWGSSSWDSDWESSSWDSSNGYSGSSYHTTHSPNGIGYFIAIVIFFFIIGALLKAVFVKAISATKVEKETITKTITEDEIKAIIPDFNKQAFLNKVYQMFIDVQNAWMNFDYDVLRKNLTDELYNTYTSQLKALEALNQKNVMEDFHKISIDISDFNYTNDSFTIKVELIVSFFDFVVNKNNQIMRGTNNRKNTNHYELTFISTRNHNNQNKCPNCGAPLQNVASSTCSYCNSTIVSNNYDWVMSKKQIKR